MPRRGDVVWTVCLQDDLVSDNACRSLYILCFLKATRFIQYCWKPTFRTSVCVSVCFCVCVVAVKTMCAWILKHKLSCCLICQPTHHYPGCIVIPLFMKHSSDFVCSKTDKAVFCVSWQFRLIYQVLFALVLSFPYLVWIDEHEQKAASVKSHHTNSLSSLCSVLCGG